jgi:hypothetical protein
MAKSRGDGYFVEALFCGEVGAWEFIISRFNEFQPGSASEGFVFSLGGKAELLHFGSGLISASIAMPVQRDPCYRMISL